MGLEVKSFHHQGKGLRDARMAPSGANHGTTSPNTTGALPSFSSMTTKSPAARNIARRSAAKKVNSSPALLHLLLPPTANAAATRQHRIWKGKPQHTRNLSRLFALLALIIIRT